MKCTGITLHSVCLNKNLKKVLFGRNMEQKNKWAKTKLHNPVSETPLLSSVITIGFHEANEWYGGTRMFE
jgi:hypothetical protein